MSRASDKLAEEIEIYTANAALVEEEREALRKAVSIIRIRTAQENKNAQTIALEGSKTEMADNKYASVEEVADMFNISVQAVYKWIKLGKIETEKFETPGSVRNLIPRMQFNVPKYQKQLESVRRTKEALAKVKPVEKNEDLFPISDEDADMEELDVE